MSVVQPQHTSSHRLVHQPAAFFLQCTSYLVRAQSKSHVNNLYSIVPTRNFRFALITLGKGCGGGLEVLMAALYFNGPSSNATEIGFAASIFKKDLISYIYLLKHF